MSDAPRVTEADLDAAIVAQQYWNPPGTTLTVCVLTLWNGFTVVGEAACVSPENYDEARGRAIAFKKAREKIWALEGYLLAATLHRSRKQTRVASGASEPGAPDTAVVVVGFWPEHGEQIWRGGIFDTEDEARDYFEHYAVAFEEGGAKPSFRRTLSVSTATTN